VRIVHARGNVTRDEAGRIRRIFGIVEDLTERKLAEAALRDRAQLLDLTHDTIFVRSMNEVISFWNRGAEQLYGWNKDKGGPRRAFSGNGVSRPGDLWSGASSSRFSAARRLCGHYSGKIGPNGASTRQIPTRDSHM